MVTDETKHEDDGGEDCPDFLSVGVLWNDRPLPWFLVSMKVRSERHFLDEVLMVPTYHHLKRVFALADDRFQIQSVDYVSPGHVNQTGKWMIEPVLQLSELTSLEGRRVPRCWVGPARIYRGSRLEYPDELGNEQVIYRNGMLLPLAPKTR